MYTSFDILPAFFVYIDLLRAFYDVGLVILLLSNNKGTGSTILLSIKLPVYSTIFSCFFFEAVLRVSVTPLVAPDFLVVSKYF